MPPTEKGDALLMKQGANQIQIQPHHSTPPVPPQPLPFSEVNSAALPHISGVVRELVGHYEIRGGKFWALNPTRADRSIGSFWIAKTGHWKDHATADGGGDLIALVAYVKGISQNDARRWLADWLGLSTSPGSYQTVKADRIDQPKQQKRTDLERLLRGAVDPSGTPVELYLRSRGLSL